MEDQLKGRGRGLALLRALKKTQVGSGESTPDDSSETSPSPSVAPSVASSMTSPVPSSLVSYLDSKLYFLYTRFCSGHQLQQKILIIVFNQYRT